MNEKQVTDIRRRLVRIMTEAADRLRQIDEPDPESQIDEMGDVLADLADGAEALLDEVNNAQGLDIAAVKRAAELLSHGSARLEASMQHGTMQEAFDHIAEWDADPREDDERVLDSTYDAATLAHILQETSHLIGLAQQALGKLWNHPPEPLADDLGVVLAATASKATLELGRLDELVRLAERKHDRLLGTKRYGLPEGIDRDAYAPVPDQVVQAEERQLEQRIRALLEETEEWITPCEAGDCHTHIEDMGAALSHMLAEGEQILSDLEATESKYKTGSEYTTRFEGSDEDARQDSMLPA